MAVIFSHETSDNVTRRFFFFFCRARCRVSQSERSVESVVRMYYNLLRTPSLQMCDEKLTYEGEANASSSLDISRVHVRSIRFRHDAIVHMYRMFLISNILKNARQKIVYQLCRLKREYTHFEIRKI